MGENIQRANDYLLRECFKCKTFFIQMKALSYPHNTSPKPMRSFRLWGMCVSCQHEAGEYVTVNGPVDVYKEVSGTDNEHGLAGTEGSKGTETGFIAAEAWKVDFTALEARVLAIEKGYASSKKCYFADCNEYGDWLVLGLYYCEKHGRELAGP